MHLVPHRVRLGLVLLTSALVLALATPASAPAQTPKVAAAPVAFKNDTDATLEVEAESIIDGFGVETRPRLTWTVKPRQYSYLGQGILNDKIYATKFNCRVKTAGKTSRWFWTSNGPDANGAFTVAFTQANLRTHLGEVLVMQPPFAPAPRAGPTQQQLENATVKILAAVVAHEVGRQSDNPFAAALALGFRDGAIESALRDLFPGLSQRQAGDIRVLIGDALDGRTNFGNDRGAAKQRLLRDLRAIDPGLADAAAIADFIYLIDRANRRR